MQLLRAAVKNILIFNTSAEAADPIYVIRATEFNGYTDSDIPVVVGYDQAHYESLHPSTELDIAKTIELVNSYIAGSYGYHKKDLQFLISSTNKQITIKNETEFPLLQPANKEIKLKSRNMIGRKEKLESKGPQQDTLKDSTGVEISETFMKLKEI